MKKVIIVCNTYYQLIVALQMKLTIKSDEYVHAVISDASKNAYSVYEKVKSIGLFDEVSFLKTPNAEHKRLKILDSLKFIKMGVFGNTMDAVDGKAYYDEFLGFNLDLPSHYIYATLKKNNPKMESNQLEEGIISYKSVAGWCGVLSAVYKIRKLLKRKNLREEAKSFYCFNPDVYKGEKQAVLIPKISNDSELKKLVSEIFLGGEQVVPYKEKYIYLPCIYDIEGGEPIGELELAKKIAATVGKENLMVKVHPRDDAEKYRAIGLNVDTNSSVPWEAIQINGDFSDKVFLTSLSGSILNINCILDSHPKSFYLYKMCSLENNALALHFKGVINSFLEMQEVTEAADITVANGLKEILN